VSYLGESTMDRRRFLWDWIDEHHPAAFKAPGYPRLKSPTLRAKALAALISHFGITSRHANQLRIGEAISRWLDSPDVFSPHLDEIALEMAIGFDWDVIAGLTQAERGTFLDRLDRMRDPFDASTEVRTTDGHGGASILVDASRRRLAYLSGPSERRYHLAEALATRRSRAKKVAA